MAIKKEASYKKVRFSNAKQRFLQSNSFADILDSMELKLNGSSNNLSLFNEGQTDLKYNILPYPKEIDEIILCDEYAGIPFLKEVEPWKVPFLFVRGENKNFEFIMSKTRDEAVSIVGSRETPEIYRQWISERMPKNKIVVSGLANGADLIGHREAMKMAMKIVVFPGYDISKNPSNKKMDVWDYALDNGLIISSVIPGTKSYVQADLLNRNYEMAKVISISYALYFGAKSGTLNHLKSVAEDGKKIIVPSNILRDIVPFLENKSIEKFTVSK